MLSAFVLLQLFKEQLDAASYDELVWTVSSFGICSLRPTHAVYSA
jgi:hypothetical protein